MKSRRKVETGGRLGVASAKWLQRTLERRKHEKSKNTDQESYLSTPRGIHRISSIIGAYIRGNAPAPYPKHRRIMSEQMKEETKTPVQQSAALLSHVRPGSSERLKVGSQTARATSVRPSYRLSASTRVPFSSRISRVATTRLDRLKYGTRTELEEYCRIWRSSMGISPDRPVSSIT